MMAVRIVWTSPTKVLPPATWSTLPPTANCEIEFISNYLLKLILIATKDGTDDELDECESEHTDDETNKAVKDSVFGFFNFASVTRGGHIVDAADDHNDDTNKTKDTDDGAEDGFDVGF